MAEAANDAATGNAPASEGRTTASATAADTSAGASITSATLAAGLEIEPLVKLNISTRAELEAWILEQKNSLQQTKSSHEQQTQDHARQTQEAQRKREVLQQQQKALAASVHDKERQVNLHQVEIEILQDEKNKKEPVLREIFLKNQEEDQKLKQLLHEASEHQTAHEQQLAELQRGLAMYQHLGLFFEHTEENQIIVRFTQIDPEEPSRAFSFRIRIDPLTDRFLGNQ
uniref:Kinetochore protein SPC25 n=1 Tax=Globisporangium ultimum (strain ATCC 200006 / CBS 805.95 / DAOM BR144) TaxID=431595 RepID=K3X650_GLOUD